MGDKEPAKKDEGKEDYDKDEKELDEEGGSEGDEAMAVEQEEEANEE